MLRKPFRLLLTAAMISSFVVSEATPSMQPQDTSTHQNIATCTGCVIDTNGEPLVGAAVRVEGTQKAVTTDLNGNFTIPDVKTGSKIAVNYVGYISKSVLFAGKPLSIALESSTSQLDEVVVVAYGVQNKASITGAVSQMKSDAIEMRPVTSVSAALEGATSGISVSSNYGVPGSSPSITIRGIGTVNGSTSPLYVVDGVAYDGDISDLNAADIESISVLKDAASCALYGNRASNGVILITTKKSKTDRLHMTLSVNQGWYERGLKEYQRTDARQFMEAEYQNLFNQYITKRSDEDAVEIARESVISSIFDTRLKLNIFDIRETENLFMNDGALNPNASILAAYAEDLDWFDQATRKGHRQEYLLSGSGASDKSDYFFSLGYLSEDGYMRDSDFSRISGRANVNVQPRKWIKSGLNINATHQNSSNTPSGAGSGGSAYNNPFYFCRYMSPIYPVHTHDINTGDYLLENGQRTYDTGWYYTTDQYGNTVSVQTRNQYSQRHVIWENELNSDKRVRNTMNGIAYVDLILPYGITATVKGNLSTRNMESSSYRSAVVGDGATSNGTLSKTSFNYKTWSMQEQLRWHYVFNQKHNVDLLLGHENYSMHFDYTYNAKENESIAGQDFLTNFSVMKTANGYPANYRTESYLGRIQYNYDNKYNIEASMRKDGSSRFASNMRWGTFGAVGVNWVFSNEDFLKDLTWLDFGKLRADWGQVGNDAGSDFYAYYTLLSRYTQESNPAFVLNQIASPNLKWETGDSWGIGLDGRLFNRWNISVEYYERNNKDLIFNVYAPLSAGATSMNSAESVVTQNLGTIKNKGFEINTDIDAWVSKDWTLNIAANLTTLTNSVTTLPPANKDGIIDSYYKIMEGHSRYDFYTYHWEGVDQMDGQSLYTPDLTAYHIALADGTIIGGTYTGNGDARVYTSQAIPSSQWRQINGKYYVTNASTYGERGYKGSALPKAYGSVSGTLRWRDLTLSAMFTYSIGGKIFDENYRQLMTVSSSPKALHSDIMNSWNGIPEGMTEDSTDRISQSINPEINASTSSLNNAVSDRWLIDRDYLCFKNLNLTYSLPRKWLSALEVNKVQLRLSAENIHTWTKRQGLNPMMGLGGEQGNYMVPARVYSFGINITL